MARIFIPSQLRELTSGISEVDIDARTLRQALAAIDQQFPGMRARLCDGDRLSASLQVSIDGALTSRGLLAPIGPDSEVHFLPAIGGG